MKKTIRDICITIVIMSIICFVFWRIGWLTSSKEVCIMYIIMATVIVTDLFIKWIWKKVFKHQ